MRLAATGLVLLGFAVFPGAMPASAENWHRIATNPDTVVAREYMEIDTDSIKKDAQGLVHYTYRDDWDWEERAFDCGNRLGFAVEYYQTKKMDWRAHPKPVGGSIDELMIDFVCARAS